jgi:hypothetical protein
MENYKVLINNIDEDDEVGGLYEIKFLNNINIGVKLAQFEFDIDEINNINSSVSNFNKLKHYDKITIFNKFVESLFNNAGNGGLYFIMTNGERSITFKDEYMKFKITAMTMECEFTVRITEELKNEFKKISQTLVEKQTK